MKRALEGTYRIAARKRQRSGRAAIAGKGSAMDLLADQFKMSRKTLQRAEAVVAAAEVEPRRFGDLVLLMDSGTKNVGGAYVILLERLSERSLRGRKAKRARASGK